MLSFEHSGMIIGLNDKVIGQIGVIIIHFISFYKYIYIFKFI